MLRLLHRTRALCPPPPSVHSKVKWSRGLASVGLPPGKGAMAKAYDPLAVEDGWYQWWQDHGLFKPKGTGDRTFSMVLPPPNVTGALHIGHALTVALQDAIVRHKRMRGDDVVWVPGLDHAGIATQSVVEKALWKNEKLTRHDLGREAFVEKVWEWKRLYGGRITDQLRRVGASLDWSREVFTLDAPRSAAVTRAFLTLYDEGLMYRRQRLVNWCSHLQTAISDIEVDTVEDGSGALSVSTTRLETMVGDVAVAVHPEDERYKHLIGKHVVNPVNGRVIPIVADAILVDPALGTGAVKVTPAHDPNDYECGIRLGLPLINVLTDDGRMNEVAGPFAGQSRFEAREGLRAFLSSRGLYVGKAPNPMALALCSRSGDVLEPLLKPQWYVKCLGTLCDTAVANVQSGKIGMRPEAQAGAWANWLTASQDWCVSRQLWWGHRIPAFRFPASLCPPGASLTHPRISVHDGSVWVVAADRAEAEALLAKAAPPSFPPGLLSSLTAALAQDEDVLDTWFSSALFPLTVFGWPEQSKELSRYYPLNVMETGQDILFFWVARMAMVCTQLTNVPPFKEVWLHPIVRDAQGKKMSKSTGNVIDPMDVITGAALVSMPCGADALRITLASYVLSSGAVAIHLDPTRAELYRAFGTKIWNAAKFVFTYAHAPAVASPGRPLSLPCGLGLARVPVSLSECTLADAWILSRLAHTAVTCQNALESFGFATAVSALYKFVFSDFCEVYIEWSKRDLNGSDPQRKAVAAGVLAAVFDGLCRLLHPFMPYLTEELWQRLHRPHLFQDTHTPRSDDLPVSIMTAPVAEAEAWKTLINPGAEEEMETVIAVLHAARQVVKAATDILPDLKRKEVSVEVCISDPVAAAALAQHAGHWESVVRAGAFAVVAAPTRAHTLCASATPSITVHVALAGESASMERLSEAAQRFQAKAAKISKAIAMTQGVLASLEAGGKAPEHVKQKSRDKLLSEQQELAAVQEVVAQIQGAIADKQSQ